MPISGPAHLAVKPPVLSEGQIAEAQRDFTHEVKREIIIAGADINDPHVVAVLEELPAKLIVQSTTLGPSVKYIWKHGGPVGSVNAAAEVVERAQARAAIANFGADPVDQVIGRLTACGLTKAEASETATGRIVRNLDGTVVSYKADGSILHKGPAPVPGRQYSREELARFADSNDAVTALVRAILEERDGRRNPRATAGISHTVRGAF